MTYKSKFHEIYPENKEAIDEEQKTLGYTKFRSKYKISYAVYRKYFGTIYDNSVENEEYINSVKKLSSKFRVSEEYIIKLNKDYTLTEIENGEKIDGVIVVDDIIRYEKQNGWMMNMYK